MIETMDSLLALVKFRSNEILISATVGEVMRILNRSFRAQFSLAAIYFQVFVPIRLGQVEIFRTSSGEPSAYLVLGYLTVEVMSKIKEDEKYILHPSEWNEGTNCCIMDIVAPNGESLHLIKQFLNKICATKECIYYVRHRNGHSFVRKINCKRR